MKSYLSWHVLGAAGELKIQCKYPTPVVVTCWINNKSIWKDHQWLRIFRSKYFRQFEFPLAGEFWEFKFHINENSNLIFLTIYMVQWCGNVLSTGELLTKLLSTSGMEYEELSFLTCFGCRWRIKNTTQVRGNIWPL
jgi:hypothetical protein